MKSLLLNNLDNILYIEKYDKNCCSVYYEDKHIEIYDIDVLKFFKSISKNNTLRSSKTKYNCPIQIGQSIFSPTKNIKDKDCEFFNLLKVDEQDPYYYNLLERKGLLDIARNRYLKHKENELYHLY